MQIAFPFWITRRQRSEMFLYSDPGVHNALSQLARRSFGSAREEGTGAFSLPLAADSLSKRQEVANVNRCPAAANLHQRRKLDVECDKAAEKILNVYWTGIEERCSLSKHLVPWWGSEINPTGVRNTTCGMPFHQLLAASRCSWNTLTKKGKEKGYFEWWRERHTQGSVTALNGRHFFPTRLPATAQLETTISSAAQIADPEKSSFCRPDLKD